MLRPTSARAAALSFVFSFGLASLAGCGGGGAAGSSSTMGMLPPNHTSGSQGSTLNTPAPQGTLKPGASPSPNKKPAPDQQPSFPDNLPIQQDTSNSTAGVYLGEACGGNAVVKCGQFAATFRHGIAMGNVYLTWPHDIANFLKNSGMTAWPAQGITPLITWQPGSGVTYAAIASGAYDSFLTQQAQELAAFGSTIFIRPFHEFNGTWYPWGLPNQGADSQADTDFIAAWQHMHDLFVSAGATNVKWVWCFDYYNLSAKWQQETPWDMPAAAYPGDAYVDWISYDAYNRGSESDGIKWASFQDIMALPYATAVAVSANKPIMVGETASNEYGDDGTTKAAWITDMLNLLGSSTNPYPNIRELNWFESDPKAYKYDTESTSDVLTAWVYGIRATTPSGALVFRSNGSDLDQVVTP